MPNRGRQNATPYLFSSSHAHSIPSSPSNIYNDWYRGRSRSPDYQLLSEHCHRCKIIWKKSGKKNQKNTTQHKHVVKPLRSVRSRPTNSTNEGRRAAAAGRARRLAFRRHELSARQCRQHGQCPITPYRYCGCRRPGIQTACKNDGVLIKSNNILNISTLFVIKPLVIIVIFI